MLRIPDEELELMPMMAPWGGGRFSYNGVPFTGVSFEYFANTQILAYEAEYIDGYVEGLQREYHSNGQMKMEWFSKDDYVYNYLKKWDEQGNLVYYVEHYDKGGIKKIVKHPNPNLEN